MTATSPSRGTGTLNIDRATIDQDHNAGPAAPAR